MRPDPLSPAEIAALRETYDAARNASPLQAGRWDHLQRELWQAMLNALPALLDAYEETNNG